LDALELELARAGVPARPASVFFGGGTPTYFDEPRLERLLRLVGRHVDLPACPEVTMEANPESVTAAKAALARSHGVRRFSMGAQSFDDRFLRLLDRAHGAARTGEAFAELRAAGIDNVNLDLIFALPGQSLPQWQADLEAALTLGPDHLACYSLTFEPGTRFTRDRRLGRLRQTDPEVDRAMFLHTRARLAAAGFTAYEVSNFAGRGGPCRHNDHYWQQGDYVGVGPGASSHRQGTRWTNLKPLEAWARALERGLPPVGEAETLTPPQRAAEAVWLGLRRTDGVCLQSVHHRIGVDPALLFAAELARLEDVGLLERSDGRLRLTAAGLLVADEVGARILRA
jgi:oxygen-independent coproporphyrinogen-3 oxidase